MFSEKDIQEIRRRGISIEQIEWQLSVFKEGTKYVKLDRAAAVEDGILRLSRKEVEHYIAYYHSLGDKSKMKFVPASGAASRMFNDLFEFMDSPDETMAAGNEFITTFFGNIEGFAFYKQLEKTIASNGESLKSLLDNKRYITILDYLLSEVGLNYGNLPKGLLLFHQYGERCRTPFEEHVVEGIEYAKTDQGRVSLHFTISPEHLGEFNKLLNIVKNTYPHKYGMRLEISFSVQKPSTDTLAVDPHNIPFREKDGNLLFRPGGHGALIDNLNELDADIIFIKNIDNVVPEKLSAPTIEYKKALAGLLLETQAKVFEILHELNATVPTKERLKEIYAFIIGKLHYVPESIPAYRDAGATIKQFKSILNRPLRVCGVVKNLGEQGGGPFWAPNGKADMSLQIIESSQVDHSNMLQAGIFNKSTYFNPVDLVCGTRNYRGKKFHLPDYVDRNTCFVSKKSKDGRELKALELPGLWNGAMADWLTLMVEVPVETFNPVKTVNDLLRPQHQ